MKATPHEFTNRDQQRREGNERQKETERRTQTTSKMTLKLEKRKKQEARNKVVNRVVRMFSLLSLIVCLSYPFLSRKGRQNKRDCVKCMLYPLQFFSPSSLGRWFTCTCRCRWRKNIDSRREKHKDISRSLRRGKNVGQRDEGLSSLFTSHSILSLSLLFKSHHLTADEGVWLPPLLTFAKCSRSWTLFLLQKVSLPCCPLFSPSLFFSPYLAVNAASLSLRQRSSFAIISNLSLSLSLFLFR